MSKDILDVIPEDPEDMAREYYEVKEKINQLEKKDNYSGNHYLSYLKKMKPMKFRLEMLRFTVSAVKGSNGMKKF